MNFAVYFISFFRGLSVVMLSVSCLVTLAVSTAHLAAQESNSLQNSTHAEGEVEEGVFSAPVVVDGEDLFLIRGSSVLPATERAENIERRIIQAAEQLGEKAAEVSIEKSELGRVITVNGRMITITTQADADLEQIELEVLAGLHAEAIQAATEGYRSSRSNEARVESAFEAVAWSIGFLIVTVLFFRRRHRVIKQVQDFSNARMMQVGEATQSVVQGHAVARLIAFLANALLWLIYLFLLYYYLSFVLLSFAETRPFAQLLLTNISEPLINVLNGFLDYLPNLITLLIITVVTRYCLNGLRLLMENVKAGTIHWRNFEPHWISPTHNIARVFVIAVALVFAYPHIPGSDSAAFQGLTILAGVMVSLGSNTVVSNMMAGLFVIYRRSTNVGDRIKVGDQIGDVVEIKLMETLIKSTKNEMVSIPNAQLLNSEVMNYSRKIDGRGILVHTTVGIGYEEPKEKIKAMLVEAALRTSNLKKTPPPFVLCTALSDYAINYQINAFSTRGSELPRILSDLHFNIIDVFSENNVQIMTPSYEADPAEPKIPNTTWSGALAGQEVEEETEVTLKS